MGVRLVATKVLQYAGRRYVPGEPFQARTTDDARFLKAVKRAIDEPAPRAVPQIPVQKPILAPEPAPEPVYEPVPEPEPIEHRILPPEATE